MSRNLLHKSRLNDFIQWLDKSGIKHRPPRGEWQVLQVFFNDNWHVIYQRLHMPEHYTTPWTMENLVRAFIEETRND